MRGRWRRSRRVYPPATAGREDWVRQDRPERELGGLVGLSGTSQPGCNGWPDLASQRAQQNRKICFGFFRTGLDKTSATDIVISHEVTKTTRTARTVRQDRDVITLRWIPSLEMVDEPGWETRAVAEPNLGNVAAGAEAGLEVAVAPKNDPGWDQEKHWRDG